MRHIDKYTPEPEPNIDLSGLRRLRNTMAVALLYSHRSKTLQAWRKAGLGDFSEWENRVEAELEKRFYEELYVLRDEIGDLENLMRLNKLTILRGERGSGKSTLLMKLEQDFRETETDRILYFDLNDHRNDPDLERQEKVSDGRERETVCALLYRAVYTRFVQGDDSVNKRWALYRLRNVAAFATVLQLLQDTLQARSDEAQLDAIKQPPYLEHWARAQAAFDAMEGTSRLDELLKFLRNDLKIQLRLIVDNIDQVNLRIQREVVDRLMSLAKHVVPVVAVRNANYQRLAPTNTGDTTFLLKKLESHSSNTDVAVDTGVLQAVLRKRFKVAIDFYKAQAPTDELHTIVSALGYRNRKDFLDAHIEVLRRFGTELTRANTIPEFLHWHNGSLRTTASQVFNLINTFLVNKDPLFRFTDQVRADHLRQDHFAGEIRALRSLAYRHIIFGGRELGKPTYAVNVFADRASASVTCALRFFPLKILEVLLHDGGHSTWGSLTKLFAEMGVGDERLFAEVFGLTESRGSIPDGLIHIDMASRKHELAEMHHDVRIELLSSGRYFVERLSTSCEYLFWTALCTETDAPLLRDQAGLLPFFKKPGAPNIESAHIRDDSFRAAVAARFLRYHVLPDFLKEVTFTGHDPLIAQVKRATYAQRFGTLPGGCYPIRAAINVRRFVTTHGLGGTFQYEQTAKLLDEVVAQCRRALDANL